MDVSTPLSAKAAASLAPVSLRQVAAAAGVSRMTVSRAFKPVAAIKPEVRARVLAVARTLGYEPDRMVTEVMTSFAKRRAVKYRETFAALWWPARWEARSKNGFSAQVRHGIEEAAARHGCGVEHVVLSANVTARTLTRMLKARGISGLVLTPPGVAAARAPELDWRQFCAVIIGTSLREPKLHRAHANHYAAMVQVLAEVRARGYRKPCLLVRPDLEERMQRAYSAAFLAWEEDAAARIWHASVAESAGLAAWLKKTKPDVVIADADNWMTLMPEKRSFGFASLAVEDRDGAISGYCQNYARVAEGAVDLLVQSRLRHETGVPEEPAIMLTAGRWVEGETLRAVKAR